MRFYADLHIHSKYSRACSRDCDLEHLTWWARRKGITVVGTGDFTHPAWLEHLRETLVPAEPGLFRLRPDLDRDVDRTLPPSCAGEVRFMLSVEISTIYKRADRTRKVHHLVYLPDFDAVTRFNTALGRIGNLGSDGRPILGLDSRDLLEITLEASPDGYLVPAHIWTPWFAVLGSKSGFDRIEDCYLDLADHIFAVETGLSSDPPMNWRVSGLDQYRLVSNSDAHSPPMLGREANVFDTELGYHTIRRALETGDGYVGTVEFFPEEGKYHVDGHRKCDVRLDPAQTRELGGLCPVCGKPLTIGVLHRVEEHADRHGTDLVPPAKSGRYHSLVPLPEIMGEILDVGPKSKRVLSHVDALTAALGPEMTILDSVPLTDIDHHDPLLAEAIGRLRRGEVIADAGFDGEYGVIRLFQPGELRRNAVIAAPGLFDDGLFDTPVVVPAPAEPKTPAAPKTHRTHEAAAAEPSVPAEPAATPTPADVAPPAEPVLPLEAAEVSLLDGLDPDQRAAAEITEGPLLIIAGPGTGKTRTLTHRIAHLITARGVPPQRCLAITFTRRAAEEMRERLAGLLGEQSGPSGPASDSADAVTVSTFHALGVRILREQHDRVGRTARFGIADPARQLATLAELTGDPKSAGRLLDDLSRYRRDQHDASTGDGDGPGDSGTDAGLGDLLDRYQAALREQDLVDFDDLIALPVRLLGEDAELAAHYRDRYRWISVDEYQDIDETQYRLLRLLTSPEGNLTAIGDPDQAIYAFRGADVGFFLRFRQDYPSARTVTLTRNYRSGHYILSGALQAIAPATLVPGRELLPAGDQTGATPVGLHHAADEDAEADFVVRTIDQLLGGSSFHSLDSGRVDGAAPEDNGGVGFADIAVLYRTDAQSRALISALTHAGMPFQKRSHDRLTDRPGVRDILRNLPASDPVDPADTGDTENPAGATAEVSALVRQAARAALEQLPESDREDRAAEIHFAVDLLGPLAGRRGTDLPGFRAELALGAEVDTWDPRADRISLLTLHAAKGLEFPVVFLVGCEDGLLPLRWPGQRDEENAAVVDEERRLFFVGMTRAQRRLYLSLAAQRSRQGSSRPASPSPFLADLHADVYQRLGDPAPRRRPKPAQLRLL